MPQHVIGLTGPFGSGCSETAKVLEERHGYRVVRLSGVLSGEWDSRSPGIPPKRSDLQSLGDEMRRQASNAGMLAERAIANLGSLNESARLVIDGIRNMGETDYLRDRFGAGFFLFALECPTSQRWLRLRHLYERAGMGLEDFRQDDERDRDEDYKYGQQVQLCVDQADVLINNTDEAGIAVLRRKVPSYVDLVTGRAPRYATPAEIFMNLAYSAAHGSKCLKRQVGAVIVAAAPGAMGDIVGQGFNENPAPTKPCVEEEQYGADARSGKRGKCYRDKVREDSYISFVANGIRCPLCGAALVEDAGGEPRWKCRNCKRDLEKYFWSERAMTLCTAIHAEVAAYSPLDVEVAVRLCIQPPFRASSAPSRSYWREFVASCLMSRILMCGPFTGSNWRRWKQSVSRAFGHAVSTRSLPALGADEESLDFTPTATPPFSCTR